MSTRVPDSPRPVFAAAQWPALAAELAASGPVGPPEHGEDVVTHRTSWVRRRRCESGDVFVKTYEYATWTSRLRNWGKHTAPWTRSRAAAEAAALRWLSAHGFGTAEPLAVLESRRLGFLARAVLVTRAWPGERADRVLAAAGAERRARLGAAIRAFVGRLHAADFRDRNLDLRNLLLREREGADVDVAKIDSPRFRLVAPGPTDDRLAREDWRRLAPQLAAFGIDDATP